MAVRSTQGQNKAVRSTQVGGGDTLLNRDLMCLNKSWLQFGFMNLTWYVG